AATTRSRLEATLADQARRGRRRDEQQPNSNRPPFAAGGPAEGRPASAPKNDAPRVGAACIRSRILRVANDSRITRGSPMSNRMSAEPESLLAGARSVAVLRHQLRLLNIAAQHRLNWYHSHYNPNQPRVPAGDPRGGQWTSAGAGDRTADPDDREPQRLIRLAQADSPDIPPKIPRLKPPTRKGRREIIRLVTEWLFAHGEDIAVGAGHWFEEFYSAIKASFDSPKTLKELQEAVATPKPGYDIHHI